jgi:hypothetical protein
LMIIAIRRNKWKYQVYLKWWIFTHHKKLDKNLNNKSNPTCF